MMNRRSFIGTTALAGAGLLQLQAAHPVPRDRTPMTSPAPDLNFPFAEWEIPQFQKALASGELSSVRLTRAYLKRIERLDRSGPSLRSVLQLNPDAEAIARQLDRERKAGRVRGVLHGIPVLIKDNIDTQDRMWTTAGSLALEGWIAPEDAFLARKLRDAGAVVLGKTNLSEWANFRSNRSSSGWSGRGGQTKNPYALDRNPSGSSSGSAVSVAANLCAVAVGTETDGSIVSPSSYSGIVGFKPTVGLISRSGIIPISHTQDTAGPMTRTVRDAALLLQVLAGRDPSDPATNSSPPPPDYLKSLDPSGLRGARIGVLRSSLGTHPVADRLFEQALEAMRSQGATIVDPAELPSRGHFGRAEFDVLLYEFKAGLNAYLSKLGPQFPARSLSALIEWNEKHRDRELIHFGQELFLLAEAKGPLTEPAYLEALKTSLRVSREEGIDAIMGQHQLDALVALTAGPAHVTDTVYGNRNTGGSSSAAAMAGYPNITVPAGQASGLPVGISFFGRRYTEATLLKLAYAYEQCSRHRQRPRFLAHAL